MAVPASIGPQSCVAATATTASSTFAERLVVGDNPTNSKPIYAGFDLYDNPVAGAADCMGASCEITGETVPLYNIAEKAWQQIPTATFICQKTNHVYSGTEGGGGIKKNYESTIWSTF